MAKWLDCITWFLRFLCLKVTDGHCWVWSFTSNKTGILKCKEARNVSYFQENLQPWRDNQTGYTLVLPGWATGWWIWDYYKWPVAGLFFWFLFACLFIQSKWLGVSGLEDIYAEILAPYISPHLIPSIVLSRQATVFSHSNLLSWWQMFKLSEVLQISGNWSLVTNWVA